MTVTPVSLTYSSVVSQESVKIAFLRAELHNLKILVADFGNAYLNADCHDKVYTNCRIRVWVEFREMCIYYLNPVWFENLRCCMENTSG